MIAWALQPQPTPDIYLVRGDYRASKTFGAMLAMTARGLKFGPKRYIVSAQSIGAIQRNVFPHAVKIANTLDYELTTNWGQAHFTLAGNHFQMYGDVDKDSYQAVQGFTDCDGALLDEEVLQTKNFVEMIMSRYDRETAITFGTCNPDHPDNWVYTDWIMDPKFRHRRIYDRATLPDACAAGVVSWSVLHRMKRTLTGHRLERGLHDRWVRAEGLCWPSLRAVEPTGARFDRIEAGVDWGTRNATACLWFGRHEGSDPERWELVEEYYYGDGSRTADQHAARIAAISLRLGCRSHRVDPAALELILHLRKAGARGVTKARNDVVEGIDAVEQGLRDGHLLVTAAAPYLLREGASYAWAEDEKKDRPVKQNDHACDALRYFWHRPRSTFGAV